MAMRLLPRTVVHLVIDFFVVDFMSSKLAKTGCMSYAPGKAGLVTGGAARSAPQVSPLALLHIYISPGTYILP